MREHARCDQVQEGGRQCTSHVPAQAFSRVPSPSLLPERPPLGVDAERVEDFITQQRVGRVGRLVEHRRERADAPAREARVERRRLEYDDDVDRVEQGHLLAEHEPRVRLCEPDRGLEQPDRRARLARRVGLPLVRVVRHDRALRWRRDRRPEGAAHELDVRAHLLERPRRCVWLRRRPLLAARLAQDVLRHVAVVLLAAPSAGAALVEEKEHHVEAREEGRGQARVDRDRAVVVVPLALWVARGKDGTLCAQLADQARLCDGQRLLLHRLVDRAAVVLADRVELVDRAHAPVGEHQRPRLEHPLASWLADGGAGEPRRRGADAGGEDGARREARGVAQQRRLAGARVADEQQVRLSPHAHAARVGV
mmetsp:Transcript_7948/g.26339  ORF Transcript_7948/g.26339 Transcript_7948/m.26339 type:complete len:367 (-) Transcript_7948:200-1300(-)